MTDKERIEKEAAEYASEIYSRDFNRLHWQNRRNGFLTGYERAQQELQAYRDIIKELIPIASKARGLEFPGDEFVKAVQTIDRAKKLIDTVTLPR